ncbi:MAG TPA: NADH-quinone oxidoreductase subunit J [Anaerolineae bacterium]|nr:NADH-quinone oxidoreductase subunit J [Anaerolineae bacterium]
MDVIIFLGLAAVAIASAVSMLISRNAIYSAIFLVMNFITVAVLYLLLNAAFIALVQVTVYAGAIMVLFLFVIMLLGAEHVETSRKLPWQLPVALIFGLILVGEFGLMLYTRMDVLAESVQSVVEGFGSPASVGSELFRTYLIPFEITSVLLLVAMVGAIVLSRNERKESR